MGSSYDHSRNRSDTSNAVRNLRNEQERSSLVTAGCGGGRGRGIEPVGDEGRKRAPAEQAREVFARAKALDEVEADLDEIAAGGRGRHGVRRHLFHRRGHQRHAYQRHLLSRRRSSSRPCSDANNPQRPRRGCGWWSGWGRV
jgi:hypothetical protein